MAGDDTEPTAALERRRATVEAQLRHDPTAFDELVGEQAQPGRSHRRNLLRAMTLGAVGVATATALGGRDAAAARSSSPGPGQRGMAARVDRLEAEHAIERTLYSYGLALDYGDRDLFLDCFTPDADYVVDMRINTAGSFTFRGHAELTAYFDGHTHAPDAWHKHITTNSLITVDGGTASATSYFIRVDAGPESGPATVLASGRYLDRLVRDAADRWRIRSRRAEVENL
jgi:hypothetical protein